jgi:hypothetical protein
MAIVQAVPVIFERKKLPKIRLAYNEFAYKKTKDAYKLRDRFLK